MRIKQKIKQFFKEEIRTRNGMVFFIVACVLFYFVFQILFGRSNLFYWGRLVLDRQTQEETLQSLEAEAKILKTSIQRIENKDRDYIDELLRKKLNRFPPNTYLLRGDE
ncbi:MAG: hypothetical protein JXR30_02165 [Alphaproteobacteria bacterium]|nr:hypothetical protein [Alphaproteobacteria bacterium]